MALFSEEQGNYTSHGLGVIMGLFSFFALFPMIKEPHGPWATTSIIIYGSSMVILFFASTLYHFKWMSHNRKKFQVFDHLSIYILIAGTYTPFCLIAMRNGSGIILFSIIWGLALIGIIYKTFFTGKLRFLSMAIYLAMGYLVVFYFEEFSTSISTDSLYWVIAGGVLYSVGALFYSIRKLPYNHFIWHVFVLLAAASHLLAVYEMLK